MSEITLSIILTILLWVLSILLGLWLWKIIAVGVFGLKMLSFWQFVGLKILIWFLSPQSATVYHKSKED